MTGTLQCFVLDCPDPLALARFYATLLDGEVNRPDRRWSLGADWATLHIAGGQVLCFQGVPDYRPPRWGDAGHPQQAHLDIGVADLDEAGAEAVRRGARVLDSGAVGRSWRVYADPAGHPFCLVRERFADA
ncbi:VOC family protein [Streptomyces dysideae]|uniref:Glyoxalase n=1 Tax=Streptomyces dysideae TaxID=909626 RepID=A0A101V2F5_9ACTN|nr:VOC family protein [Streptomyces dysideae]KUO21294.1 glyoxalase [Streptomyces dysideae]